MNHDAGRDVIPCGDPRVPMAAERTLLAWVRTGLAMMGFGFVVARFGVFLREVAGVRDGAAPTPGPSLWLGAVLVILGVVVNLLATANHLRFHRDLKRGMVREPTAWSLAVVVTLLMAMIGLGMVAYLVGQGV